MYNVYRLYSNIILTRLVRFHLPKTDIIIYASPESSPCALYQFVAFYVSVAMRCQGFCNNLLVN